MSSFGSQHLRREELLELGFVAIGRHTMVSRRAVFHVVTGTLGDNVRIDDFAVLTGEIHLDAAAHVSTHCFLGGTGAPISFGRESGVAAGTAIYTKSEDYSKPTLGTKVVGAVVLEDMVAVGSHCTIMPGTRIGTGAKVGANAVIGGTVRPYTINVSRSASLVTIADYSGASAEGDAQAV